jgi:hypothetical protein
MAGVNHDSFFKLIAAGAAFFVSAWPLMAHSQFSIHPPLREVRGGVRTACAGRVVMAASPPRR